jgi:hypothetical protein
VSTFELDLYWASGRPRGTPLEAHVAECERCRAYLVSLDALAADAPAPPSALPAHANAALRLAPHASGNPRAWALPAFGAMALAASIVLLARTASRPSNGYVAMKGTPAVEILIHRDQATGVWDGRSPVRPGDSLALRVACEGLHVVAVASPGPAGWRRLSETPCPTSGAALPFTLVVDDQPGDEQLAVVLSQDRLDDALLSTAIGGTERDAEVWVVKLVLPKTVPGQ